MRKRCEVKVTNHICNYLFQHRKEAKGLDSPLKASVREIGWLKQLKVVISTRAGMPSEVKSTKFVKQILSTYTRIFAISEFVKQFTTSS
jgi:hypothetical protein